MRYKRNEPRLGEKRILKKFLFLPICIKGEYRWLEKVSIQQKFYVLNQTNDTKWHNMRFVDN